MTDHIEDIQDFCLDVDANFSCTKNVALTSDISDVNTSISHHKRKRSWSETRNVPTDIFQDSYLSWKPEHTTIQMPSESISYVEHNCWNTCKTSVKVLISLVCVLSMYVCFIYSFRSIVRHL